MMIAHKKTFKIGRGWGGGNPVGKRHLSEDLKDGASHKEEQVEQHSRLKELQMQRPPGRKELGLFEETQEE